MDLLLQTIRTAGRAPSVPDFEILGEVGAEELALMQEPRGSEAPPLKRLQQRHHALARNIAAGVPAGEAALLCGYVPSRVSILLADPTFKELVKFYSQDLERVYYGLHETLSALAHDAAEELRTRLEEEPDSLSVGQLTELVKTGADRTGFGPSSKTDVNVTVGIADKLNAARERVAQRRMLELTATEVVDATVVE